MIIQSNFAQDIKYRLIVDGVGPREVSITKSVILKHAQKYCVKNNSHTTELVMYMD
jgi:hypothetical protein